jgi:plasmid stability protein
MPNVLIRDVEENTLAQLKAQAQRNGRSLQRELQTLLTTAAHTLSDEATATQIKEALRGRVFSDSAAQLREERAR